MTISTTKTRFIRLLACVCAFALMLGGCSNPGTSSGGTNAPAGSTSAPSGNPTGGYIETELDTSAYSTVAALASDSDGNIWAAGKRNDNEKWELIKWADAAGGYQSFPIEIDGDVSKLSVSPDGNIALLVTMTNMASGPVFGEPAGGESVSTSGGPERSFGGSDGGPQNVISGIRNESTIYWLDQAGNILKEQSVSLSNDIVSSFAALENFETLIYSMMSGISRYDENMENIATYFSGYVSAFAVFGDSLYVLDGMSGSLFAYDINTGSQTAEVAGMPSINGSAYIAADENAVYLVCSDGVWEIGITAKSCVQTLESVNYSLNDPSYSIAAAASAGGGTLIISLSSGMMGGMSMTAGAAVFIGDGVSGGETHLYAYAWSAELDLSNMRELVITGLRDSQQLRKAISEFQRLHPDVRVSLKTYLESGDAETDTTDYIRTINAELLAGKGADVLILDGLPIDSYIKKGVLLDLTDILSGAGLLPGIASGSLSSDGKAYGLPALFSFGTLWGSRDVIDSISGLGDLAELAGSLDDSKTLIAPKSVKDLISLFFSANKNQFADSSGNLKFDTQEFERFLEILYALHSEPEAGGGAGSGGRVGGAMRMGTASLNMDEVLQMANRSIELLSLDVSSIMQVNTAYSVAGAEDGAWMGIPNLDGDSLSYVPSLIAGVNSQSANRELAVEFVRLLFSDEVQEMAGQNGLPTTVKALDKLFEDAQESNVMMSLSMAGGPTLEFKNADDATWKALRDYCDNVKNPVTKDETLLAFMVEETAKFFEGSKSAHDTADALQKRVAAYLAE